MPDKCPMCRAERMIGRATLRFACETNIHPDLGTMQSERCKTRQIANLKAELKNTKAELDEVKSYTVDRDMDNQALKAELERVRGENEKAIKLLYKMSDMLHDFELSGIKLSKNQDKVWIEVTDFLCGLI